LEQQSLAQDEYQQTLINDSGFTETPHKKILCAREEKYRAIKTKRMLNGFEAAAADANADEVRKLVREYANGYHTSQHRELAIVK
jgi:hypothetical protein